MNTAYFFLCFLVLSGGAPQDEYFQWCGEKLNPWEHAKAMRVATESMLACKEDIMRINVSPQILQESKRLCILFRICFAYGSFTNNTLDEFRQSYMRCISKALEVTYILNPELFDQYRANVTAIVEAATRCSYHMIPREEKYTLATLAFFKDFISG